ncbi:MAG: hypothetical protein ACYTEQ_01630 [Planctomycetota bacterium]|jgi:hypothetical protein
MNLVYVISVYGGRYRIDKDLYDRGRAILHRYNSKGKPIEVDRHGTVGLHRDNIKRFC